MLQLQSVPNTRSILPLPSSAIRRLQTCGTQPPTTIGATLARPLWVFLVVVGHSHAFPCVLPSSRFHRLPWLVGPSVLPFQLCAPAYHMINVPQRFAAPSICVQPLVMCSSFEILLFHRMSRCISLPDLQPCSSIGAQRAGRQQ